MKNLLILVTALLVCFGACSVERSKSAALGLTLQPGQSALVACAPTGGAAGAPTVLGGARATGGRSAATGGRASTGGAVATGGSSAVVVINWPPCSNTFKSGPVVKHKLGRRVVPQSMRTVQPWHNTGVVVRSVLWPVNCTAELAGKPPCIPYDQGNLGACTVFAEMGELSTAPFTHFFSNATGPTWYTWETNNDPFAGAWPPDDTGSDGASAQKTAVHFGYSTGFVSAATLADMHAAIQTRPGIFGSNWTTDMFSPDRCGQIHPTGAVEGGHEYEYIGFDKTGKEWFRNSWGPTYGLNGYFWLTSDDTQTLIDDGASADFANVP